ncbi:MAG: hypothetical protein ABI137_16090 [Antricoccus sp.]
MPRRSSSQITHVGQRRVGHELPLDVPVETFLVITAAENQGCTVTA